MFRNCFELLPILLLSYVIRQGATEVRETEFVKFHLCSGSMTVSGIALARSRIHCIGLCAALDNCTTCSYHSEGTCTLYSGNANDNACGTPEPSGAHYRKVISIPTAICQNGGIQINATACRCQNGYVGDTCDRLMIDCTEGMQSGHYPAMTGFYLAQPALASQPIRLRCQAGVGQIILFRQDGDVEFNVSKVSYVSGFGNDVTDYWVGLETLHQVTSNSKYYFLGVQISNFSNDPFYQHYYDGFKVKSAAEGYAMTFDNNRSDSWGLVMGDCLTPLKDVPFSTYDDDNDADDSRNCAADFGGGWWYVGNISCSDCNLVGELRRWAMTRQPGNVAEVFWNPGTPQDFSPFNVAIFLVRV